MCYPAPLTEPASRLAVGRVSLTLACVSLWMLAVGLRTFEALYMITVFEGFMILSGAISGNIVMNEKLGLPWLNVCLYSVGILIILCGLYILCKGEQAGAEGRLLTRQMQPASDAEHLLEMRDERELEEVPRQRRPESEADSTSPSGRQANSE